MTLGQQIFWGSSILSLCLLLQVFCLSYCVRLLELAAVRIRHMGQALQISLMLMLTLVVLVFALTAQIWLWSLIWIVFDIIPDWNGAVYFSLVTFTTLGYGDIVLGPPVRIFGTFAAVTGLLSFGLSTAFLVTMTSRLVARGNGSHKSGENKRAKGAP